VDGVGTLGIPQSGTVATLVVLLRRLAQQQYLTVADLQLYPSVVADFFCSLAPNTPDAVASLKQAQNHAAMLEVCMAVVVGYLLLSYQQHCFPKRILELSLFTD